MAYPPQNPGYPPPDQGIPAYAQPGYQPQSYPPQPPPPGYPVQQPYPAQAPPYPGQYPPQPGYPPQQPYPGQYPTQPGYPPQQTVVQPVIVQQPMPYEKRKRKHSTDAGDACCFGLCAGLACCCLMDSCDDCIDIDCGACCGDMDFD